MFTELQFQTEAAKVRGHFSERKSEEGFSKTDNRQKTARAAIHYASQICINARTGEKKGDVYTKPPKNVSFDDVCQHQLGASSEKIFKLAGIDLDTMSLYQIAEALGYSANGFSQDELKSLISSYNSSSYPTHSAKQYQAYRFIIPEIFLQAIQDNYEHTALWPNWVAANVPTGTFYNNSIPVINQGDMTMAKKEEGEDIALGNFSVGVRGVKLDTFAIGFKISDELLVSTPFALLATVIQMVTSGVGLGEDVRALNTIVSGSQGSDGAAIVGVKSTANGYEQNDIDYVIGEQSVGGVAPDVLIGRTSELIKDLNSANANRDYLTLQDYFRNQASVGGNTPTVSNFPLPASVANDLIMFNKASSIFRVQFGTLQIEEERKASRLENHIYFNIKSGFYTGKSNSRFILDQGLQRTIGGANDFPDSYKIDAFVAANSFDNY